MSLKPKQLLALSVAAGLVAVLIAFLQLRSVRGSSITVYRATTSAVAGQPLGDRVEPVTLPAERQFPELSREAPTGSEMDEFVSGTPLRRPIREWEIVLYRHLESSVDAGIRTHIPPGMKAVAIPVDEEGAVSYLIEPGDRVDVLATLPRRQGRRPGLAAVTVDGPEELPALEVRPILQNVQVLAVGTRDVSTDPSLAGRSAYGAVTLLVSMEEAQKLAYVRDALRSPMTLALRSPDDGAIDAETRPVSIDSPDFERIGNRRRPQSPEPSES
jgi:pilus assembly protein CpaB